MKFEGTIVLPMPKVSDANSAEWGKSQVDGSELRRLQMEGIGLGMGQRGLDERQERSMMNSTSLLQQITLLLFHVTRVCVKNYILKKYFVNS